MSPEPTHRSADLERLRDEGYNIALVSGLLVVSDVPYVAPDRSVKRGQLKVMLRMAGNVTLPPNYHSVAWEGERPSDAMGAPLTGMNAVGPATSNSKNQTLTLCHKPDGREFHDYHELVTSYVNMFGRQAVLVDPSCTARTGRGVMADQNMNSPFHYIDTAAARAGVHSLASRLEGQNIGIIGLGGTGSYVLDLVSKTPVAHIHLFDGDQFEQHNAFRAPGAASIDDLRARRDKVRYLSGIYSRMHRGIVPHPIRMEGPHLSLLDRLDFVFLCVDETSNRATIIDRLEARNIPFIDTGLGLQVGAEGVFGLARVTTSIAGDRQGQQGSIPLEAVDANDPYRTNVQVADLNALNACLAVIRWKQLCGYYAASTQDHQMVYVLSSNRLFSQP